MTKYLYIAPVVVYFAVSLLFFFTKGVMIGGDSARYIDGATALLNGENLPGKASSYLGYVSWVMLFTQIFALPLVAVVIGQVLWGALITAWTLYAAQKADYLFPVSVGLILFFIYPDALLWNQYILTDGPYVFTSLGLFASLLLFSEKKNIFCLSIVLIFWILCMAIRPTGWFLSLLVVPWVFYQCLSGVGRLILVPISLLGTFLFLYLLLGKFGGEQEGIVSHFTSGTILWNYYDWRMKMPVLDDISDSTIELLRYGLTYPAESLALVSARVVALFVPLRPYYSTAHNLLLGIYFFIIYSALLVSLFRSEWSRVHYLCLLFVCVVVFLTSITFVVSDGRWTVYMLPFLTMAIMPKLSLPKS